MINEGALTQQQTGGSVPTTNPQSIPSSDLQPQQSGLQGMGSQVLGTSTFLEQSSNAAISVNGQNVDQELTELKTSQESSTNSLQGIIDGREVWVIGGITLLIGVLIYVLTKQIMRDRTS